MNPRSLVFIRTTVTPEQVEALRGVFAKLTPDGWKVPGWLELLDTITAMPHLQQTGCYWPGIPWRGDDDTGCTRAEEDNCE